MIKVVKKTTRGDVTNIILKTIKVAGFLSVALVTPRVLDAFEKLGLTHIYKSRRGVINRAREVLIKNGSLRKNKEGFLELTQKGKERLRKYELSNYTLNIPRIWDKKWRILTFDIPEKRKDTRDKIRVTLNHVGFVKLQNSVWVFPYDCEELVALLKADLRVGKDLLYVVADKIENDFVLKKYFKLK